MKLPFQGCNKAIMFKYAVKPSNSINFLRESKPNSVKITIISQDAIQQGENQVKSR